MTATGRAIPQAWKALAREHAFLHDKNRRTQRRAADHLPMPLARSGRVAALVPHYNCAEWLDSCLQGLFAQTRRPDAVVVLDDCSPETPVALVETYAEVTLLRSSENVGPYNLIQSAIDLLPEYDGFLFNDADDFSLPNRLEGLLDFAEQRGLDLVGCQQINLNLGSGMIEPKNFPPDANSILRRQAKHVLSHGSSLVSASLVRTLGGYARGLRYGADTDFLWRAHWVARIGSAPFYGYVCRRRPESLTTHAETGLGSAARIALQEQLKEQDRGRRTRVAAGLPPDVRPLYDAVPAAFDHVTGPELPS
jgi:hypothetical protein